MKTSNGNITRIFKKLPNVYIYITAKKLDIKFNRTTIEL